MSNKRIHYPFATSFESRQSSAVSASLPAGPVQPSRLPAIPTATPPLGGDNNWLVPVARRDEKAALRADNFSEDGDRLYAFETRLGVTEKSNRALMEEVIRLHSELRVNVRKNQETIKEEQLSRNNLENSLSLCNELINKLSSRIKQAEDKITAERSALSSLVSHTKGVEQAVISSQQNLAIKKDSQNTKMQELSIQLSEMQRSRELMEKQQFTLSEELRSMRSKVEGQSVELNTTISDLKLRSRRLEEENKIQLDALRKQGDAFNSSETNTTHLRGQVETRLSELRDVVLDLRNRQDLETSDRRSLDQQMQQKVNQLQQSLIEQNRKREEAMHAMDMIHREKEHSAENEKLRLQGKLTETVEEVNKRLLTKEIKLREELQEKFNHLEKLVQQEQIVRQRTEAGLKEENERWRQGLKKVSDDDMLAIKDTFQSERQKNKEAVKKLDESISLIEKQLSENKRQSDKVVMAEIKSRKQHEKNTEEKLDHINEKLALATSSLQAALGGVQGSLGQHTDKLRSEMKAMVASSEQASTRSLTDMDARMQSLKQKVGTLETNLDGRISEIMRLLPGPEATAILAQNLREKVESISLWQDVTSQTIRELNQSIQGLPNDQTQLLDNQAESKNLSASFDKSIYAIEEKQKLMKTDFDSRLTSETDNRLREIEALKHEVSLLKNKRQPNFATAEDMQELQISVRKLAESIQSVKTVIGMKIQSEQKLREDDVKELHDEVDTLSKKVDNLAERTEPPPRNEDRNDGRNDRDNRDNNDRNDDR